MKDGWRMFGAGCLGAFIGFVAYAVLAMEQENDWQADQIASRIQRTIQFHFDHWRHEITEAQRSRERRDGADS